MQLTMRHFSSYLATWYQLYAGTQADPPLTTSLGLGFWGHRVKIITRSSHGRLPSFSATTWGVVGWWQGTASQHACMERVQPCGFLAQDCLLSLGAEEVSEPYCHHAALWLRILQMSFSSCCPGLAPAMVLSTALSFHWTKSSGSTGICQLHIPGAVAAAKAWTQQENDPWISIREPWASRSPTEFRGS